MKIESLIKDVAAKMEHAVEALVRDFNGIRTGKASTSMVDGITVEYYGTQSRLRDVASVSCPEPRMIQIQPWDLKAVPAIEKAILNSDLGITPVSDGRLIRLPIPELSEERRKQMAKLVGKRSEEGKIEIRNIRRDANEIVKKANKASEVTEDEMKSLTDEIQKLTDSYVKNISDKSVEKEKDLLKI
ncbi:MAG: ribosome recycling factor [Lentisphaeria bacterium]